MPPLSVLELRATPSITTHVLVSVVAFAVIVIAAAILLVAINSGFLDD